jgi:hypothetical protein
VEIDGVYPDVIRQDCSLVAIGDRPHLTLPRTPGSSKIGLTGGKYPFGDYGRIRKLTLLQLEILGLRVKRVPKSIGSR